MVVGPGPVQVGGVATFTDILLSSRLAQRYELIHLDTTRGARGAGRACTFAWINFWYFIRQGLNFIWLQVRLRPRLMHVPITSFISFWKGAAFILMGRASRMKIVAHLHGGMFGQFYRGCPSVIRWLIRWVLHRADVIVALSAEWKRLLLEQIASDLVVEVVPNTVDRAFAQVACRGTTSRSRGQGQVLFVGALGRDKGIFDILKAVPSVVDHCPDVRFAFAGAEDVKGGRMQIDRICTEANLDGAVSFLGVVTGEAKQELFLNSTVFVLPSYGENLPMVVLEAMAVGLPVIATPVGALPGLIKDGVNGFLIQPGDYQALADRLVQLLADAPLRRAMSKANRERIRTAYMPEVAMSRFDEVYSQLLDIDQE